MSVYAHNLATPHAVVSDEEIEAANSRSIAAAAALTRVSDLPEPSTRLLVYLAYLGYTVEVREMPDGEPMIYLPAAASLHINTADGIPVVWLIGLIAPRDWIAIDPTTNITYGERITAALLDAG